MARASYLALAAFAVALTVTASPPGFAASRAMRMLDTDNDGTIDMKEATAAATALFARLDRHHSGKLDAKELRGRVNAAEFKAADPDKDGTLSKDKYLALVAQRFKRADKDNDGTIDEQELRSTAGRSLQLLLRR
jgi:Ca2+-binding EF-hand superfamily protein